MATPTYTALATVQADGSTSTFNFTNIPNTYRDLAIVFTGRYKVGSDSINMRYNSNNDNQYMTVHMEGNGSSTGGSNNRSTLFNMNLGARMGTTQSNLLIQVLDYAVTDKFKLALSRFDCTANSDNNVATKAAAHHWGLTLAIDEINLIFNSNLQTDSTISLYGIAG